MISISSEPVWCHCYPENISILRMGCAENNLILKIWCSELVWQVHVLNVITLSMSICTSGEKNSVQSAHVNIEHLDLLRCVFFSLWIVMNLLRFPPTNWLQHVKYSSFEFPCHFLSIIAVLTGFHFAVSGSDWYIRRVRTRHKHTVQF